VKVRVKRVGVVLLGITLSLLTCLPSGSTLHAREPANIGCREAEHVIVTIDRLVPHISTVPANAEAPVELLVREPGRHGGDDTRQNEHHHRRPVVLMVHGATQSTVVTAMRDGQSMTAPSSIPQPRNAAVTALDVSDGRIDRTRDGRLEVNTKELRASIRGTTGRSIAVHFMYLGPTREVSRLANGEVRHQFVLALRAKDICNMVFVGWHFLDPDPADAIVVQVKSNPSERTHEACLDHGYQTVTSFAAPPVRLNQGHTFAASIEGQILTVMIDGTVKQVVLPDVAHAFDGPDALRSDNAHVIFTYEAQ
jgi:hypothetical protein